MHFYNTTGGMDNQDDKPFVDVSKTGKVRPWKERKIENVGYAELLNILKFKKTENVLSSGKILELKNTDERNLKSLKTWFCKCKLCQICNWRQSKKNSVQTQIIVESVIDENLNARYLYLTLTSKNVVDGKTLKD